MGASKLLKSLSFFMYMFKRTSSLTIQSLGFSCWNITYQCRSRYLDLNGDNGNVDGPLVANAQNSLLSQLVPCNTEKINSVCGSARLKETNGEVILHTVASTTTGSKRETSNFTSKFDLEAIEATVVSLDSASTSSG
ncbi:hypothetical protein Scep_007505 [Stephania cephalantha]|uniref:Uncharacterized protein n=1 Tax=Stephania cephalantha TaxID=152367 RepID=A0AAP0PL70_9MAGN